MSLTLQSIHARCIAQVRLATPLGDMLLARSADGLLGAWFDGQQHHPGELAAPLREADSLLRNAMQQLSRYFAGELHEFTLTIDLHGTSFQRQVWDALRAIPPGGTQSYGEIAAGVGAANAARAVGAAVGRNPLSVIVPCHRVLGAAGALTGYAGGLERKVTLLELERRARARVRAAMPAEAVA